MKKIVSGGGVYIMGLEICLHSSLGTEDVIIAQCKQIMQLVQ